jgi:hypothetical protein
VLRRSVEIAGQAIQVLDRCLAARVLLLQSLIDFVTLWVAPKSSFSNFTVVNIGHKWPSTKLSTLDYICATAITASALKSFLRRCGFRR